MSSGEILARLFVGKPDYMKGFIGSTNYHDVVMRVYFMFKRFFLQ